VSEEHYDSEEKLITRCLTGEGTPEEHARLQAWRGQHPDHEARFRSLEKALRLTEGWRPVQPHAMPAIDIEQEWQTFQHRVNPAAAGRVRSLTPIRPMPWLRVAAAVALLITAGWFVQRWWASAGNVVVETSLAMQVVQLPDGSTVTLNRNSKLTYAADFGAHSREVTLEGEAFFEVVRDESRTFAIAAGGARVEVLGTSFNVRADQQLGQVEVVVATGQVKLASAAADAAVKLSAGERGVLRIKENQVQATPNADVNFDAWKTKDIVFEEVPLAAVVEALNRIYGSNIQVRTTLAPSCVVTVSFHQQSLEAVLEVLKNTLALEYRVQSDVIEIVAAGC
jgi:ferric-dicitrate binding protein FerR (iron transport regulator)